MLEKLPMCSAGESIHVLQDKTIRFALHDVGDDMVDDAASVILAT